MGKEKENACPSLGRDNERVQDTETAAGEAGGLLDVLIEQAKRDEAIIAKIGEAVSSGDKDRVFELAKELAPHD